MGKVGLMKPKRHTVALDHGSQSVASVVLVLENLKIKHN
jgi:hypothetical protein